MRVAETNDVDEVLTFLRRRAILESGLGANALHRAGEERSRGGRLFLIAEARRHFGDEMVFRRAIALLLGTVKPVTPAKLRRSTKARIGQEHGSAKLTAAHVRGARFLTRRGLSATQVCEWLRKDFGIRVSRSSIQQAVSGTTWSHVSGAVTTT